MRRIIKGGADRSYGIHVAKLAGLPPQVLKRAEIILSTLEEPGSSTEDLQSRVATTELASQKSMPQIGSESDGFGNLFTHSVVDTLLALDINTMTPIEAINAIHQLQLEARNGGGK